VQQRCDLSDVAALAAVLVRLRTTPEATSTPICAFMWRGDLSEKAATIRMRTPVSRRSHDYRDVIVAQERLGFLFVVARQSELVLIVALAGGRPGPRLRSRAVRRR